MAGVPLLPEISMKTFSGTSLGASGPTPSGRSTPLHFAITAPLGGCSRMLSVLDHKGAGCMSAVVHDRVRGLSCMNGMLNGQGHAGAVRLHAIGVSCNQHLTYRCPASLLNGQSQQRLWKRWAKTSRLTRHTVRVSAMAAMPQLLPVTSTFGIWATLNLAAALGLWSERTRHAPHMLQHVCYAHTAMLLAFLCAPAES